MTTSANPISQPPVSVDISPMRCFLWSVRRELWENRYVYLAPLAVAALIVIGYAFGLTDLPARLRVDLELGQHQGIVRPYDFAALLLMFTTVLVAAFYCLDALYGERRDRSILFWKSLPVSDLTAVLAKATIPLIVIPLLTWAITLATHSLMLLLATLRLAGTGLSVWSHVSLGETTLILFNHLIFGHGFWYAPFWGWLLLVSAWSRRTPYLWATLPLLAVALVEKIAFNTSHFGGWIANRFLGGPVAMPTDQHSSMMAALTPSLAQVVTSPGLWYGLAFTALCLYLAARLRRHQSPN